MNSNFVICIGRELGSGGLLIGKTLSQDLGIGFYDKEILKLASKESGLDKEIFEERDEKTIRTIYGNLFGIQGCFVNDFNSAFYLSNEKMFSIQSKVIRSIAEKESCVFVGRSADYVLKDHPRCLSVFIVADMPDRIKRVCEYEDISESKAKDFINKMDKRRASYYNFFTNKSWGEASSYHLSINSSVLGIDGSVEIIKEMIKRRFGI